MVLSSRTTAPDGLVPALQACRLLRDLDAPALADVASLLRHRRFRRQEVVFHAGDPGESVFVITSGSVKICVVSPDGDEAIIATLRQGDFFGELAVLGGEPRSATAIALEPTEMGELTRAPFMRLIDTQPAVRLALLVGLAVEVQRLTRHVEELHFLALPGRLAMRLVELAHEASGDGPGAELSWHYTQSDLAAMIGGSRQSVSRLLGDLAAEGLLRIEHDLIVIPDVDTLARVARR